MKTIDVARLREVLDYDPDTGVFTWKISAGRNAKVGDIAGSVLFSGYLRIGVGYQSFRAHRLAIAFTDGVFPPDQVDHINGDRQDNRRANLRLATGSENLQNMAISTRNTSGFMGVSFKKRRAQWAAQINRKGVAFYLGYFDTPEEAHAAYLAAKAQIHTFQPRPR